MYSLVEEPSPLVASIDVVSDWKSTSETSLQKRNCELMHLQKEPRHHLLFVYLTGLPFTRNATHEEMMLFNGIALSVKFRKFWSKILVHKYCTHFAFVPLVIGDATFKVTFMSRHTR